MTPRNLLCGAGCVVRKVMEGGDDGDAFSAHPVKGKKRTRKGHLEELARLKKLRVERRINPDYVAEEDPPPPTEEILEVPRAVVGDASKRDAAAACQRLSRKRRTCISSDASENKNYLWQARLEAGRRLVVDVFEDQSYSAVQDEDTRSLAEILKKHNIPKTIKTQTSYVNIALHEKKTGHDRFFGMPDPED